MGDMSAWWLAFGAVPPGAGLYAWGACHPASQIFGATLRRTPTAATIALTFDDGPNPAVTPRLLDLLDRHRTRATFFLIGRWVRACPSLAAEIAARGHGVGNHTDTHPSLVWLSKRRVADELRRCQLAIEQAVAWRPAWTRPPYGFRGPQLRAVVQQSGLRGVVMWSASARDWFPQPAARVIGRLRRVRGGDIVLMHDGNQSTLGVDREHTLQALEFWLPRWRDAGLRCVSLDESAGCQPGEGSGPPTT